MPGTPIKMRIWRYRLAIENPERKSFKTSEHNYLLDCQ
jgi:hypothetical protein